MSNQSGYSRNSQPRSFYTNHGSYSTEPGHLYGVAREMGPPYLSQPPQPIEIDLNSSRTLPSPSASSSNAWDQAMFPSHGIGEASPIASTNFQKNLQMEVQGRAVNQDPLVNWYTDNDGPWIPKNISDVVADARSSRARVSSRMPIPYGNHYRQPLPSDAGSYPYGPPPSDSGYGSNAAKRSDGNASIFSADVNDRDQDLQSLAGHIADLQPYQGIDEVLQPRVNDHWTNPLPTSIPDPQPKLTCPTCKKAVKTPSELKKHDLRHRKPYRCEYPGCPRTEGFSTTNDLDRHTKSKHPLAAQGTDSTKRFRCLVPGCKSSEKSWPRLDNFRSHLKRVHHLQSTEEEDMIRRCSEFWDSPNGNQDMISIPHTYALTGTSNSIEVEHTPAGILSNEPNWKQVFPQNMEPYQDSLDPTASHLGGHKTELEPQVKVTSPDAVLLKAIVQPSDIFSAPQVHDHPASLGNILIAPVSTDESSVKEASSPPPAATPTMKPNFQGKAIRQDVSASETAKLTEIIRTALVGTRISGEDDTSSLHDSEQRAVRDPRSPTRRLSSPGLNSMSRAISGDHIKRADSPASQDRDLEAQRKAAEVLKAFHDLGYIIHKDPTHSAKPFNPGSVASSKSEHLVTCLTCGKFKGRPCELKKHMKRHSRPYGCTFTNCNKTFGSKNDWKRHENSQHFHLEKWRCNEEKPEGGACAKVCYRRETFQDHLRKDHSISDEETLKSKLECCRIGRNCQARFWCGFCIRLIDLTKKGVEAWTERFDHIDNHFMGRQDLPKQSIQEWIEMDSNKARGEGQTLGSSQAKETDEESLSPSGSSSDGSGSAGESPAHAEILAPPVVAPTKRKHSSSSDDQGSWKRSRISSRATQVYCCQCGLAHNIKIDMKCTTCTDSHEFCNNCTREEHEDPDGRP